MAISDQSISTTASSPYGWPADSRVLFTTTDSTDYTVFLVKHARASSGVKRRKAPSGSLHTWRIPINYSLILHEPYS